MLNNIFQNPFFNKKPFTKWSFIVDFSMLHLYIVDESLKTLSNAVINCSWAKKNIQTVPVYYAGLSQNLPARYNNNGQLEMTFNESYDLEVSDILNSLFATTSFNDNFITDDKELSPYRQNDEIEENMIRLILLETDELSISAYKPIKIIEFHNCWLSNINQEEFSYDNSEDILKRTVTWEFAYMVEHKLNDEDLDSILNESRMNQHIKSQEQVIAELDEKWVTSQIENERSDMLRSSEEETKLETKTYEEAMTKLAEIKEQEIKKAAVEKYKMEDSHSNSTPEAVKQSQKVAEITNNSNEMRINELIEKVHTGKIKSKGGWIKNAEKEGYTDDEIKGARKYFNGNETYKNNWAKYIAEKK